MRKNQIEFRVLTGESHDCGWLYDVSVDAHEGIQCFFVGAGVIKPLSDWPRQMSATTAREIAEGLVLMADLAEISIDITT